MIAVVIFRYTFFFVRGFSHLMDLEIDWYFVYILGTILVEYEW